MPGTVADCRPAACLLTVPGTGTRGGDPGPGPKGQAPPGAGCDGFFTVPGTTNAGGGANRDPPVGGEG